MMCIVSRLGCVITISAAGIIGINWSIKLHRLATYSLQIQTSLAYSQWCLTSSPLVYLECEQIEYQIYFSMFRCLEWNQLIWISSQNEIFRKPYHSEEKSCACLSKTVLYVMSWLGLDPPVRVARPCGLAAITTGVHVFNARVGFMMWTTTTT